MMETYFFKMILCSAIFIGFYYLILEKQKAHHFKRFYLLLSILFSMLIPFFSISYGVVKEVRSRLVEVNEMGQISAPVMVEKSVFSAENIICSLYLLITLFLLVRFLISLNALRKEINSGTKIKKGNFTIVLKEEPVTAHSFWKYIFLNRKDFEEGRIDEKIIRHEETHLQQKHSFDVLLIEFLLTVFWFNPAFYFYKKAMLTNHEFLADENVLKANTNVKDYQKLLLTELISEKILFTNQFNLSNTKKRIDMMTKKPNYKSKLYSWLTLPLAALLFFVFVEKVPATTVLPTPEKSSKPEQIQQEIKEPAITTKKVVDTLKKPTLEDMRKKEIELEKAKKNVESAMSELTKKSKELHEIRQQIPPPSPPLEDSKSQSAQVVDKLPVFPGGINNFRTLVANNFDSSKMNSINGTYKIYLYFTINIDGSTSDYKAEGDNEIFKQEALRTIEMVSANSKWEPATLDGKAVPYIFKLPLTMHFEALNSKK